MESHESQEDIEKDANDNLKTEKPNIVMSGLGFMKSYESESDEEQQERENDALDAILEEEEQKSAKRKQNEIKEIERIEKNPFAKINRRRNRLQQALNYGLQNLQNLEILEDMDMVNQDPFLYTPFQEQAVLGDEMLTQAADDVILDLGDPFRFINAIDSKKESSMAQDGNNFRTSNSKYSTTEQDKEEAHGMTPGVCNNDPEIQLLSFKNVNNAIENEMVEAQTIEPALIESENFQGNTSEELRSLSVNEAPEIENEMVAEQEIDERVGVDAAETDSSMVEKNSSEIARSLSANIENKGENESALDSEMVEAQTIEPALIESENFQGNTSEELRSLSVNEASEIDHNMVADPLEFYFDDTNLILVERSDSDPRRSLSHKGENEVSILNDAEIAGFLTSILSAPDSDENVFSHLEGPLSEVTDKNLEGAQEFEYSNSDHIASLVNEVLDMEELNSSEENSESSLSSSSTSDTLSFEKSSNESISNDVEPPTLAETLANVVARAFKNFSIYSDIRNDESEEIRYRTPRPDAKSTVSKNTTISPTGL